MKSILYELFEKDSFKISLLRALCRSPEFYNYAIKEKHLTDKVFAVPGHEHDRETIYQHLFKLLVYLDSPPYEQEFLLTLITSEYNKKLFTEPFYQALCSCIEQIYKENELNISFLKTHLDEFIQYYSFKNFKYKLSKIVDIEQAKLLSEKFIEIFNIPPQKIDNFLIQPFDALILRQELSESIPTGYHQIDYYLAGGIRKGEFGILIGYTGRGKTAFAVSLALHAALINKKVVYVTLEDSKESISARLYSSIFEINYSDLYSYKPDAIEKLKSLFSQQQSVNSFIHNKLKENIYILDLKSLGRITVKELKNTYLSKLPLPIDLVIIDQFSFLDTHLKNDQEWLREQQIIYELDDLSHSTIQNQPFALWLVHQAKTPYKNKVEINIAGFKGLLRPVEYAFLLLRDDLESSIMKVICIKNRHGPLFTISMRAKLEYMKFEELSDLASIKFDSTQLEQIDQVLEF